MGLREYLIKRIIISIILIFGVLTVNFLIFEAMPGNPLENYISRLALSGREDIQQLVEQMREEWGLDKPILEKYTIYIRNMLTFNLGESVIRGRTKVADLLWERIPNTLLLLGTSSVFAIVIGTVIGVLAAYKRESLFDSSMVLFSLLTFSLPVFWMGMILQGIFGFQLKILPIFGTTSIPPPKDFFAYWIDRIYHLILPGFTLFLFTYGNYVLLARACVLETITEDYVITAKAKGLKDRTILFKHVLRNASLPIITNAALTFGFILSGAIITETVFNYAGMGTLVYNAIMQKDVPVMQGFFYITALTVIIANLIADLAYGVLDPRVRYG
ncbi:ABC transporter permease [Candidatus Bathyarchaeota archaeon]|nr:MAG: ABC transporter permease [Candidatus Bathyarchaeota archaeon]